MAIRRLVEYAVQCDATGCNESLVWGAETGCVVLSQTGGNGLRRVRAGLNASALIAASGASPCGASRLPGAWPCRRMRCIGNDSIQVVLRLTPGRLADRLVPVRYESGSARPHTNRKDVWQTTWPGRACNRPAGLFF